MASSRKPARTDPSALLIDKVAQRVAACAAFVVSGGAPTVAVALSGGRDSAALLHAAAAWRDVAGAPVRLVALHVHHGLQADADAWEAACARMAAAVGAEFHVRRVRVSADAGCGIEEAAREARYAALDALCAEAGATLLLTAHHLDDQAETVLLQLLRGAGLDGLSAMPMARQRRVTLLRPWLDVPRSDIDAYARAHALAWVEDPSNDDARYARNALRPLLAGMAGHFPAYRASLARSAAHLAEAAALIEEVAQADLARIAPAGALALADLATLSGPRQRAVLRAWLAGAGLRAASSRRLEDLRTQLLSARADGALCVRLSGAHVRRYRGQAWIEVAGQPEAGPAACPIAVAQFDPAQPEVQRVDVAEWGGALVFSPAQAEGIDARILRAPLSLTARRGGERIVLRPGGPSRALKQAYQEAGIPAWARARLPLLYAGDRLVFAAGLGLDRSAVATGPGWRIAWLPAGGDDALSAS
ncbi:MULTISPECIES: tRNA lysidine(34) synthetase TilS [Ralstonia solanacearum species complex]|uniref:tRNA lysidine(34) synthetase TilS n=1 Tax=Ralstonia solanacearum species complex TaxID=3116862 RepID=UPI000E578843|nr:tRNA lysidine(34) synthetase TilS [Ralstonia solanacearum]AXV77372.1 tRNA lysidine(34) synthetase TilS [Ralstonia solanacearum]AXV91392.1 tRNA lysidine(34) synthetase TilS [Ralstonia solanacearum]AXW19520.1 tRNA lysidine(34) synthetase TilS [Ralstonia solanacearum]AXW62387.1 tRNA lysidine(34) synthetase TilS [Ralstonia solanacearum]AXW76297.1 tRNA lysidine(34) synthetase TilS [Ralstonia solanacearum]